MTTTLQDVHGIEELTQLASEFSKLASARQLNEEDLRNCISKMKTEYGRIQPGYFPKGDPLDQLPTFLEKLLPGVLSGTSTMADEIRRISEAAVEHGKGHLPRLRELAGMPPKED